MPKILRSILPPTSWKQELCSSSGLLWSRQIEPWGLPKPGDNRAKQGYSNDCAAYVELKESQDPGWSSFDAVSKTLEERESDDFIFFLTTACLYICLN
jgi:hypothetical protein